MKTVKIYATAKRRYGGTDYRAEGLPLGMREDDAENLIALTHDMGWWVSGFRYYPETGVATWNENFD